MAFSVYPAELKAGRRNWVAVSRLREALENRPASMA